MKTVDELNKLSTNNLLRYYRAERKRYKMAISSYYFGFDHIDFVWDYSDDPDLQTERVRFEAWNDYLQLIKSILSTREHIQKQHK